MVLSYFLDRAGALGKLERTPQGGFVAPATLARVGVMGYLAGPMRRQGVDVPAQFRDTDIVQVYTPTDVLREASDTLGPACPVTNEHPPRMVGTDTWRDVACGAVVPGSVAFDGTYLRAQLAIQDAALLADIEIGARREVSMGYGASTAFEPGTTPEGEAYDAVRTRIVYNHAAIVASGRAGRKVCLALDSEEIPNEETMLKIKGNEIAADAAQAAIDTLEGELAAAHAAVEALAEKLAASQAALGEATSDAAIDAAVAKREAEREAARAAEAKLARVKAAFPAICLDGRSADYIDGLHSAIPADDGAALLLPGKPAPAPVVDAAPKTPRLSARDRMVLRNRGIEVDSAE